MSGAQPSTKAFICLKYQVYFSRKLMLACALSAKKNHHFGGFFLLS